MATYPGGKNGAGVYQKIINLMPPHQAYVEGFFGGGAIMRLKKPAPKMNVAIDIDPEVIRQARLMAGPGGPLAHVPELRIYRQSFFYWLEFFGQALGPQGLLYLDPPYMRSSRRSQDPIYRYELDDEEHYQLLKGIKALACMVMISGYRTDLYDQELAGWRRVDYLAMTRGGTQATESVWCSFPEPFELHDYQYLGDGFRERERIKRKKARWKARLLKQPPQERAALFMAIQEIKDEALSRG